MDLYTHVTNAFDSAESEARALRRELSAAKNERNHYQDRAATWHMRFVIAFVYAAMATVWSGWVLLS